MGAVNHYFQYIMSIQLLRFVRRSIRTGCPEEDALSTVELCAQEKRDVYSCRARNARHGSWISSALSVS